MRKAIITIIGILLLSFIIAVFFYQKMPVEMASHWNAAGNVDGYMGKIWGIFLMPIITLALTILIFMLPRIDPLKKNVDKFRKYYDGFMMIFVTYMLYIYLITLIWNLGYKFNMIQMLTPSFAILFYYCGILMQHAKRNWFIGIRTPWTLSDDKVWDKTHKLGAVLFKISGLLCLIGFVMPQYAIWLVLVPVLSSSIVLFVYSYLVYKKMLIWI
jgi:uncharacterized membrane protein